MIMYVDIYIYLYMNIHVHKHMFFGGFRRFTISTCVAKFALPFLRSNNTLFCDDNRVRSTTCRSTAFPVSIYGWP